MVRRRVLWVPLAAFALLMLVVGRGLWRAPGRPVRSALIGQTLPAFALPAMVAGKAGLSTVAFRNGKPRLLNVFASWCIPCIAEAPQLMRLKAMGVSIDAIAIRDTPAALRDFLCRNGDPYDRIGSDFDGAVQRAIGSSGVPETFVIDGKGVIRSRHVGDIRAEDVVAIATAVGSAR